MADHLDHLIEIMLEGDDDALDTFLLTESERDDVLNNLGGETTLMNYLLLFEEFLENHDIYLFDGWEQAEIIGKPRVEKFWVVFHLRIGPKADLRGARRIRDAAEQNQVRAKRQTDGSYLIQFTILKRDLDRIEQINQEKINQLSDEAVGK